MSFDIGIDGRYVFYVGFRVIGDGTGFAVATQEFTFSNLIDDTSNYVISLERFRLPIQSIPMLPASDPLVPFLAFSPKPGKDVPTIVFDLKETFSLNDFMTQLSEIDLGATVFSIRGDGRFEVFSDMWDDYNLLLSSTASQIFDLPIVVRGEVPTVVGRSPFFDRFDDLYMLQLEARTGLGAVQQEIISTQVFRNTLTDFLSPTTISMSYSGQQGAPHNSTYQLTYPVRQDVEFQASSNRRFVMLKGNSPIQNISLEMYAIFRNGDRQRIILPPRSVFDLKLAFWKKK